MKQLLISNLLFLSIITLISQEKFSNAPIPTLQPLLNQQIKYLDLESPENNIRQALIELINKESNAIKIIMYYFTDTAIIKALKAAVKERMINVEIIVDSKCPQTNVSKLAPYAKIYTYDCGRGILHHKRIAFEGLGIIGEGSYNFTYSAQTFNKENFSFYQYTNHNGLFMPKYQRFINRFVQLLQKAKPLIV